MLHLPCNRSVSSQTQPAIQANFLTVIFFFSHKFFVWATDKTNNILNLRKTFSERKKKLYRFLFEYLPIDDTKYFKCLQINQKFNWNNTYTSTIYCWVIVYEVQDRVCCAYSSPLLFVFLFLHLIWFIYKKKKRQEETRKNQSNGIEIESYA